MHIHFSNSKEILNDLILRYPTLATQKAAIEAAYRILVQCYENGGKLLLCGNGGSAADALHIAGELMKSFLLPRPVDSELAQALHAAYPADADFLCAKLEQALPAIPLVESAAISTAVQNDTASALVFAQQVYGLGNPGDVLLAISTSGNSANVVYAAEVARSLGMQVISLTGKTPNKLEMISDCIIGVDDIETFRIQELHLPIYHALCLMLENHFFGEEG